MQRSLAVEGLDMVRKAQGRGAEVKETGQEGLDKSLLLSPTFSMDK